MLSKKAQVNRVRGFFGNTAANIVRAILNNQICKEGDAIIVTVDSGVRVEVEKEIDVVAGNLTKKIRVKNGVAIGIFVDGKEPEYHFDRPEENK